VEVAAFTVVRQLRGSVDARILVLGAAQLSKHLRNVDRLLFLTREPSGCVYRIVDAIDLVDEADAVEAMVRGFLGLVGDTDPARKREGLKQLIRDGHALRSEFPRRLAARELERLARRAPPVLTVDELAEFAAASASAPQDELPRIQGALDAAEDAYLRNLAGTQAAIARGPRRAQYVKAVVEYLRTIDPAPREAAVDRIALKFGTLAAPFLLKLVDDEAMRARALLHLGAMQWRPAAPDLLARLSGSPADPTALIECLGEVGDESAVPVIGRYLSRAESFEAASLALARLRSPAADRVLDAMLRELRKDPRQAPRVENIVRLRSAAFRDEDAALRLEARGRYPKE
jgi:hypothetical protein